jgi:hypothetical protein
MRIHKDFFGQHDLDDPNTYKYLPTTARELDDLMFKEIGMAIVYMDYFHPDMWSTVPHENPLRNSGYEQRKRIMEMVEYFANNRKSNYNNVLWLQERVFLFQSETENMC